MVRRLAPMALRTPISRVRSATETNMMFMMPMPPTNSDRLVTNRPTTAMVRGLLMEHVDDLVLLVDGKIVRLVRAQMADVAHGLAQFLPGFVQLRQAAGLHFDLINVGTVPDVRQKFPDRNDDLVVQASAAEHTALFFQHADDLKGLVLILIRLPSGDSP